MCCTCCSSSRCPFFCSWNKGSFWVFVPCIIERLEANILSCGLLWNTLTEESESLSRRTRREVCEIEVIRRCSCSFEFLWASPPHFAAVKVTGSSQRVVAHVTSGQGNSSGWPICFFQSFFLSDANSSAEWKSIKREAHAAFSFVCQALRDTKALVTCRLTCKSCL